MKKQLEVAIVCPIFNEVQSINLFYSRYKAAIAESADKYKFYLLFSDNRSTDGSVEKIKEIQKFDPSVGLICLSRNFGYQASVCAALNIIDSDLSIVVDCDCEDPPEMIPLLLDKIESGYDIVYGERVDRTENKVITMTRNFFYRFLKRIGDYDIILYMAEFALITKAVREACLKNTSCNSFPFLRAEIGYVGFKRVGIPYKRESRAFGKSYYNLIGMVMFAIAGILTSSTFPLRLISYGLPFLVLVNISNLILAVEVIWVLVINLTYISMCLSILAAYIARIYKNGLQRDVYIIDHKLSSHKYDVKP
ncbi:glycosyltransferase family 2 protein [Litoricolaceae bacterium]|nr:glycosyltransferase family 2 protein [Litorivicinaceae bacterium]